MHLTSDLCLVAHQMVQSALGNSLNCRKSGTCVPFCLQFTIVFRKQANSVFFVFFGTFTVLIFSLFAPLKTFRFFLLTGASVDGVPITLALMNRYY